MCRSVRGGTLAVPRSRVEGAMRCAGVYGRPWRVHARPPLPRSMQHLSGGCTVRPASCIGSGVSSSARIQRHPKFRMLNFAQFTLA